MKSRMCGQPALGQAHRTCCYHSGAGCKDFVGGNTAWGRGSRASWHPPGPCPQPHQGGQPGVPPGGPPGVAQLFLPVPRLAPDPACALWERDQPVGPRFSGDRGWAAGEGGQDRLGQTRGQETRVSQRQHGGHPKDLLTSSRWASQLAILGAPRQPGWC